MTQSKRVKLPKGTKRKTLSDDFLRVWMLYTDHPPPPGEVKFHPMRDWRFDFAFPALKLAIELHGGVHSGGRHVRGYGIVADCRKKCQAVLRGWRVLEYTTDDFSQRPKAMVREILECAGLG